MNVHRVVAGASVALLASFVPSVAFIGPAAADPGNGAEHVHIEYHDGELDYVLDGLQNITSARDPNGHQLVMVHGTYSATLRMFPGCVLTDVQIGGGDVKQETVDYTCAPVQAVT